jgi:hypothetical protein
MGNMQYHSRVLLQYTWRGSRKTQRGAAVKVLQHTQQPFETVLCMGRVNSVRPLQLRRKIFGHDAFQNGMLSIVQKMTNAFLPKGGWLCTML